MPKKTTLVSTTLAAPADHSLPPVKASDQPLVFMAIF